MADRLFADFLLIVRLAYAYIAWVLIEAPFQYHPLGPEGWPRILAAAASPCLLYIFSGGRTPSRLRSPGTLGSGLP